MRAGREGGRRFASALGTLSLLLLAFLWISMDNRPPDTNRPTVLLSVDRTLWHRLGLSRFTYRRALARAGARVRVFDHAAPAAGESDEAAARRLLEGVDALVLSGGGDVDPSLYGGDPADSLSVEPRRDRFELALFRMARSRGLPVLGICRGAQMVNVAAGGTLRTIRKEPALRRVHGRFLGHPVDLAPGSRLARLLGSERIERVVSYHGQAVERPGEGLAIVGRAPDGVVEAIEPVDPDEESWLVGVQWHPELSPRGPRHRALFSGLVAAAAAVRAHPAGSPRPTR